MKSLGSHLRNLLDRTTIASRLYGNIFAVYVPDVPSEARTDLRDSIRSQLSGTCDIKQLNTSFRSPQDGDPGDLLNNTSVELNLANGDSAIEETYELNEILREGKIQLVKQPIVSFLSATPVGYEILVLGPEESKFESPGQLFKAAYQQGRVVSLDTLIIKKALNPSPTSPNQLLFVNVERKSIVDEEWRKVLVDAVTSASNDQQICIEITEHGDLTNIKPSMDELQEQLGSNVNFAIDDFGTGSSNFKAIIDLNPDILKVDRSLIRNIDREFGKRSFVESILYFTETNDTRVLAEGIEESSEWTTLKELGVEWAQGYFFDRPEAI